jgi:hypothetical protein
MRSKDIVVLIREQDDQLRQTPMSLAAETRMLRRLREAAAIPARRNGAWGGVLVVGALAGGAAVLGWSKLRPAAPVATVERNTASASSHRDPGQCAVRQEHDRVDVSGPCTLQLPSVTLRTEAASEVQATQEGIQVLHGRAWFEVAPVPRGAPPVRVRVGGGIIEVVGTKFVVNQDEQKGSVDLSEGRIRFLPIDAAPVEIRPGQQVRWTNVPMVRPMPSPAVESPNGSAVHQKTASASPTWASPAAKRVAASPTADPGAPDTRGDAGPTTAADGPGGSPLSAEATALRVMRLRAEGRYNEAMTALAELHAANVDEHTAEILSFEEGNILEHLEQTSAICSHWKQYLDRFPNGQYRSFVVKQMSRDGCP